MIDVGSNNCSESVSVAYIYIYIYTYSDPIRCSLPLFFHTLPYFPMSNLSHCHGYYDFNLNSLVTHIFNFTKQHAVNSLNQKYFAPSQNNSFSVT